ncbi:MAG: hypothetical protein V7719_18700 [Psychroserpens sp.]|uniref:hypothetical protein n=1 Tax=Psychroserpens sp. TaxID=2020870 RepID=UPI003002F157
MKKLYTILAAVLVTASTFAQAPEKMSYQAVVRNSSDILVTNQAVGMQISILQTTPMGTAVYVETHTPTTNVNGLVTLEIGTGNVVSGDFTTIDWSTDSYFIKTETDPNGGISYTITGTSQLLSVPYALHAKTAENVTNESQTIEQVLVMGNNANGNDLINTGQIVIGTDTPNTEASMEIATPLPVIFPSMTQNEVNAIATPVEGMVQFNSDARKLQVYAMLTDNASILNEIYAGSELSDEFCIDQSITSPIDGQIVAIELLLKDGNFGPGPHNIDFLGASFEQFTIPSYSSFTWFTFNLATPIPVSAGGSAFLTFCVAFELTFATNSNYPNGECFEASFSTPSAQDDLVFRVHIQPNPGSFGWQNMN